MAKPTKAEIAALQKLPFKIYERRIARPRAIMLTPYNQVQIVLWMRNTKNVMDISEQILYSKEWFFECFSAYQGYFLVETEHDCFELWSRWRFERHFKQIDGPRYLTARAETHHIDSLTDFED